jgi:hypothetical protein
MGVMRSYAQPYPPLTPAAAPTAAAIISATSPVVSTP